MKILFIDVEVHMCPPYSFKNVNMLNYFTYFIFLFGCQFQLSICLCVKKTWYNNNYYILTDVMSIHPHPMFKSINVLIQNLVRVFVIFPHIWMNIFLWFSPMMLHFWGIIDINDLWYYCQTRNYWFQGLSLNLAAILFSE